MLKLLFCISLLQFSSAFADECLPDGTSVDTFIHDMKKIDSHVKKNKEDFFNHPYLEYLLELRNQNVKVLEGSDKLQGGIIDGQNKIRVDLLIADTIDQISLLLESKKWSKYKAEIYNVLGNKPIENFYKLLVVLKKLSDKDKTFLKTLNKIQWQEYNLSGQAVVGKISIFRKGGFLRMMRVSKVSRFNSVANQPESENVIRAIAVEKRHPFITNRATVTKLSKLKKAEIKEIQNEADKEYSRLLDSANKVDERKYGKIADLTFSPKKDLFKKERVKAIGKVSNEVNNETLLLFNSIDNHPQKNQILNYINQNIESKDKLEVHTNKAGQNT